VTLTFYLLIQKSDQHIYESIYNCGPTWVKFPLLVFERWRSQAFPVIACCDHDLRLFDPKSSSAQLWAHSHLEPKLAEISFIVFLDMVFTSFRAIACCDLDLWPFDPKS